MLVKCICTNCAGHLEFEQDSAGEKIKCPHCGFDTVLFLPGTEEAEARVASLTKKLRMQRRLFWGVGLVLILGGLGWCLYQWGMPWVESVTGIENRIVQALLLVISCITAVLVVTWLFVPLLLFFQFRQTNRVLAQIEINLRPQEVEAPVPQPEDAQVPAVENAEGS
jgi:hypothetical protein